MHTVGIMTYHWTGNYGALLQAYALQKALASLGCESEVIDYRNRYREFHDLSPLQIIKRTVRRGLERNVSCGRKRRERTAEFRSQYLKTSATAFATQGDLYDSPPSYEVYITGSDQVWNPRNNGFDQAYFLTFAPDSARTVAYAASFGISRLPRRYWGDYRVWLRQIEFLSTREFEGKRIIAEVANRDAEVVLDPTLLLEQTEWDQIALPPRDRTPYILCYSVTGDHKTRASMERVAQDVSKMTGWQQLFVGSWTQAPLGQRRLAGDVGPCEFVGLIAGAAIVITDSFHGTTFAISYRKPFLTFINRRFPRNSRLLTLASLLNVRGRLWEIHESRAVTPETVQLEYNDVETAIQVERQRSIAFLKRALSLQGQAVVAEESEGS